MRLIQHLCFLSPPQQQRKVCVELHTSVLTREDRVRDVTLSSICPRKGAFAVFFGGTPVLRPTAFCRCGCQSVFQSLPRVHLSETRPPGLAGSFDRTETDKLKWAVVTRQPPDWVSIYRFQFKHLAECVPVLHPLLLIFKWWLPPVLLMRLIRGLFKKIKGPKQRRLWLIPKHRMMNSWINSLVLSRFDRNWLSLSSIRAFSSWRHFDHRDWSHKAACPQKHLSE